ncbi:MAG: hypothetical protein KAI86_17525 [Desulfobacterales bacterium]|nr:hypothetical protein [Desulfobacterales bacterium]
MEEKVFNRGMIRLTTLLSKNISEEDLPIFYDELEFIPDEAWPEIIDKAKEQWESWPRNFPKAIRVLWAGWRKGHKAELDFQDCRFCQETGILEYFKPDETDYSAHESCFCGYCNNYLRHVNSLNFIMERDDRKVRCKSLRLTVTEIAARGWLWAEPPPIVSYEECKAARDEMFKAIDERSKKIRLSPFEKYGLKDETRAPQTQQFIDSTKE